MFHKITPTKNKIPVLISSPHAGFEYPLSEQPNPNPEYLHDKIDCDYEVHKVLMPMLDSGATILYSKYSRYLIDLNRDPVHSKPLYDDGRLALGLIPEKTFLGKDIYPIKIENDIKSERTQKYHTPYHSEIQKFIESSKKEFGRAIVIELHSIYPNLDLLYPEPLPDITMGTHHQKSLEPRLHQSLMNALDGIDLNIAWNKPFAGGFITRNYHDITNKVYTLQFEINKNLYLGESKEVDSKKLLKLQSQLIPKLQDWLDTACCD